MGEPAGGKDRAATGDRLGQLERLFHTIDEAKLSSDEANRRAMAGKLLQSAHKAFDQGDIAEASALLPKISVILTPLARATSQRP
jgi:hypothetical protein